MKIENKEGVGETALYDENATQIANVNENEEYFFEGTEKLLEVWFASSIPTRQKDLQTVPK